MKNVQEMEELYSDYRCDICSAPLIGIHPWEHKYGSEEAREYECGRTIGAPYGDTPCTKDPKFPRFDDFELVFREERGGWICSALSNTSVRLYDTYGKNQEEAKTEMYKRYSERARPWGGS